MTPLERAEQDLREAYEGLVLPGRQDPRLSRLVQAVRKHDAEIARQYLVDPSDEEDESYNRGIQQVAHVIEEGGM